MEAQLGAVVETELKGDAGGQELQEQLPFPPFEGSADPQGGPGLHLRPGEISQNEKGDRPQTVGYGLVDSPVGLAGWILEKMWAWTDNSGSPYDALSRDRILDNIMLYWLPATGASSARLYWESFSKFGEGQVSILAGASQFPREIIPAPRKWAERRYTNLVYWNDLPKGGHFAAWEQPELFAGELRACFGKMLAS